MALATCCAAEGEPHGDSILGVVPVGAADGGEADDQRRGDLEREVGRDLRVETRKMSDFGAASWQQPSPSERAAWLHGFSWDERAAWKQVSSSEEAVVASRAAAKTGTFNMMVDLLEQIDDVLLRLPY